MSDRLIQGSWLDAYLAYTAEQESPEDFHLWVGISCIAGALRRRVFFNMGYFILYPNLYIVLVSPPGRCKKSTSMRIGREPLSNVVGIEISPDSTTRERLIQDLSGSYKDGQSALTAHSTEFASLLTSSGMDMVVFLTDIYDSPGTWVHKTKSTGTNTIKSPFLNLLGATTPDWISRAMPLDTIGVGLTSRIIFVFHDTPRVRSAIPKLTEEQKLLGQMLANDLNVISTLSGEFTWEGGEEGPVFKYYDDWYRAHVQNPNPTGDPRLNGYFERKPMHILKLAMVVCASRSDELVFHMKDIEDAISLLERIEPRMSQVFSGVGKNPLHADRETILATIMQTDGGVTEGQLLEKFGYSLRRDELLEVLDTLRIIGAIHQDPASKKWIARTLIQI